MKPQPLLPICSSRLLSRTALHRVIHYLFQCATRFLSRFIKLFFFDRFTILKYMLQEYKQIKLSDWTPLLLKKETENWAAHSKWSFDFFRYFLDWGISAFFSEQAL